MTSLRMLMASFILLAPVAAPLAAQDPPTLPAASPPPTAPAPAPKVVPPPANAVAQCNDLTFVVPPAQPTACGTRGGVKLTLPGVRPAPAPPAAATPSVRAATPQPAASARNDAPPAGATMRCRDGTWLSGTPSDSRCDRNGGLAVTLPAPRAAPARVP